MALTGSMNVCRSGNCKTQFQSVQNQVFTESKKDLISSAVTSEFAQEVIWQTVGNVSNILSGRFRSNQNKPIPIRFQPFSLVSMQFSSSWHSVTFRNLLNEKRQKDLGKEAFILVRLNLSQGIYYI